MYHFFAQSLRNRLLLVLLLVSVPALVGGSAYSVYMTRNMMLANTERLQQARAASLMLSTHEFLSGVRGDVLFLGQLRAIQDLLTLSATADEAAHEVARQVLARDLLAFSQAKGIYHQISFVDVQGLEVARVDSDGTQVSIAPPEQFQNWAAQDDFVQTIGLPEAAVWVSPLELHRVRGEIAQPFKPVIRYATPVWFNGRVSGIVVVSVYADHFLATLGAQAEAGETLVLTDADGYYLYHSTDATKCWGRDLRTGLTLLQDYPLMLDSIFQPEATTQTDVLRAGADFLAFQRFTPPAATTYQWLVFSIRPYRAVMSPMLRFEWGMLGWLLLGSCGVVALGYWSGERLVRPLRMLTPQVTLWEHGEFARPIEVDKHTRSRSDELGRLIQTLEQTRGAWQRAHEALDGQIQHLAGRLGMMQKAANISSIIMTILDPQKLLSDGVNLLSAQLGFYHTGIFLLDETREWIVLRAASSLGGQRLLSHGYRLRVARAGVVGQAVLTAAPHIAVPGDEDTWLPARVDLPDTHAEVALPMRFQGRVIGVLDIHAVLTDAFTEDNVPILQILADQLALMWHNNQLYKESQERYDAVLRAQGEYSRRAWAELSRALAGGGYRYHSRILSQAEDFWSPEMTVALTRGETTLAEVTPEAVALPLRVRDQIIGVVDARKPDGTLWTSEELALLETVRGRLEVALESARFYRDSQRSAAREQLLREITEHIRSAVDVESVLRTAVLEIGRTLGREVFVYLVDEQATPSPDATVDGGEM
ncbi:MAG TPA: GAF domain-containing protein [Anaerolineae bacterium]|nr:GAF domain-containing protein [Anaerolineae bacterium]